MIESQKAQVLQKSKITWFMGILFIVAIGLMYLAIANNI
jgi:hypothetical protein